MPNAPITISAEFELIPVTPPIPQTVYRFWSESSQSHFYTISEQEKEEIIKKYPPRVWNYEGPAFQAYPEQISDTNLVHRFYSLTNRKHFYTISDQEADKIKNNAYPEAKFVYEGKAWFANQAQVPNTTPLHRFYSGPYKVHFYTINEQEKDYIIKTYPNIWTYEGIAWWAVR